MKKVIYIFDFDDSFTFNIYSVLSSSTLDKYNLKIVVINKSEIIAFLNNFKRDDISKAVFIYGPGPGRPKDYTKYLEAIKNHIHDKNIFHLGICLGHQLLWNILGKDTEHCRYPVHGQSYRLPDHKVFAHLAQENDLMVQSYNSLTIKLDDNDIEQFQASGWKLIVCDQELLASMKANFLTYQFHPESIGTTCPEVFFTPVIDFLL